MPITVPDIGGDFIQARNDAQARANAQIAIAHDRARQPIVEGQQDALAQQKIASGDIGNQQAQQTLSEGKANADYTAHQRDMQARGLFAGAVYSALQNAPPGTKPSDIAATAPPALKKGVGLDTPDSLQQFASVYDNNPDLLRAHQQAYGQAPEVKSITRGVGPDGKTPGTIVVTNSGTHFVPGMAPDKQFSPMQSDSGYIGAKVAELEARANKENRDPVLKPNDPARPLGQAESDALADTVDRHVANSQQMLDQIDRALKLTNGSSAGLAAHSAGIAGTPAANLKASLDAIGASRIQQFMQESANDLKGSGVRQPLGQKLDLIERNRGLTTEQTQDPTILKSQLNELKAAMLERQQAIKDAYARSLKNGHAMSRTQLDNAPPAAAGAPKIIKYDAQGNRVN